MLYLSTESVCHEIDQASNISTSSTKKIKKRFLRQEKKVQIADILTKAASREKQKQDVLSQAFDAHGDIST